MILKAIERAFYVSEIRNEPKIYWAIDLHGVVLKSTYSQYDYQFINDHALDALKKISEDENNVIIIWSSCHKHEQPKILEFLRSNGIAAKYFNENPEIENTISGDFMTKFYFSILLDDKAGFDPEVDWVEIINFLNRE